MTTLTTYLLFDGSCKQAMEFYKSCLGGELTLVKVAESPAKDYMPAAMHDRVINARLKGAGIDISASDWLMPNRTPMRGNTVCMFLSGGTKQELKGFFDRLTEGADITDPLKDVFHGLYGALNDKFGVRWMFQTSSNE